MTSPAGSPDRQFVRWAVLFEGGLLVGACLLGWLIGYPPDSFLPSLGDGASWGRETLVGLVASLPMIAALVLMSRFPLKPWRALVRFVDAHLVPLFRGASIAEFAVISCLAGIGEELLFRGVIQQVLTGWWGILSAVLIGSLVFGLMHYLTTAYAVLTVFVGLYFGWLTVARNGLLVAPMVAHAVYDFVALLYLAGGPYRQSRNSGPENA